MIALIRYIHAYLRRCWTFSRRFPERGALLKSIVIMSRWLKTINGRCSPLELEIPWMAMTATQKMERWLKPNMKVLEFGSGASTLFFAARAGQVESVEHDSAWAEQVGRTLHQRLLQHCRIHSVPPVPSDSAGTPSDPDSYMSSDSRCLGLSFESYVRVLDQFPDDTFDLILVDGRARPSCCKHAKAKVRPGGFVILDNNFDRPEYDNVAQLFKGWQREDVSGPVPCEHSFSVATFWRRPEPSPS